jgi:hypothetical protein
MRMDWRPFVGLRPEDAGTVVERVIARAVLANVIELQEQAMREAEKG